MHKRATMWFCCVLMKQIHYREKVYIHASYTNGSMQAMSICAYTRTHHTHFITYNKYICSLRVIYKYLRQITSLFLNIFSVTIPYTTKDENLKNLCVCARAHVSICVHECAVYLTTQNTVVLRAGRESFRHRIFDFFKLF